MKKINWKKRFFIKKNKIIENYYFYKFISFSLKNSLKKQCFYLNFFKTN